MMKGINVVGCVVAAVFSAGAFALAAENKPRQVWTYEYEMGKGDTIYNVCAKLARPTENINQIVYDTLKENGITDSGTVQPGQKVVIVVK